MPRRRKPTTGFRPAWPGQVCSLGWELLDMVEDDLNVELTSDQQRRLIRLYELDPVTGRRLVRRAALRRPKGAGKSPEAGYVGYVELCGPVLFDGWDDDGQPIGARWGDVVQGLHTAHPWVQFAAVSEDQTDNVMDWLYERLIDLPDTCAANGLDVGKTRILLTDRPGRLEIVSSRGDSREGQRVTFAVLDQSEAWSKSNGGIALAATLRRNTAKMGGWSYELQNAPEPDDGSVADATSKAKDSPGVLFDTIVPPMVEHIEKPENRAALIEALGIAYGDAALRVEGGVVKGWVNLERLADEAVDPDNDPANTYRYYLNIPEVQSERAFDRKKWPALAKDAAGDDVELPAEGRGIVVGFDGSLYDDSTALVAGDIETGVVWLHAIWKRPEHDDDWEVPALEVGDEVADLFARWSVWRLYGDPAHWRDSMAMWAGKHDEDGADGRKIVEWWTNRKQVAYACRNLASAIRSGTLHHVQNDDLDAHVRNAVKVKISAYDADRRTLWTIGKPKPSLKIDAAMALVLAWEARNDALASGWEPPVERHVAVPVRLR